MTNINISYVSDREKAKSGLSRWILVKMRSKSYPTVFASSVLANWVFQFANILCYRFFVKNTLQGTEGEELIGMHLYSGHGYRKRILIN